jgi:alpha-L-fucosidase
VTNTPYGKDVIRQLADACARKNMPLSLYYSWPDWYHPDYPNHGRHHQMFGPRPGEKQNRDNYYAYVKNQITELLTNYGKIYQLFWDLNVDEYSDLTINDYVRSLQPGVLICDRGPANSDYSTPERRIPSGKEFNRPTEANTSFGRESWGYKPDEDYYSDKFLMQSIDKVLAMGGNHLINVGPKPDGTWPGENIRSLKKIGTWYNKVKEAFTGTWPASYMVERDEMEMEGGAVTVVRDEVWVTRRENILYVHLPHDPQSTSILLKPLDQMPKKVTLLNDGRELEAKVDVVPWHWKEKPWLRIRGLPVNEMTDTVMVIKIEFGYDVTE